MSIFHLHPVAKVTSSRREPIDDSWGSIVSEIILANRVPAEALDGIESFSHLEIVYLFDQVDEESIVKSGRPRGNPRFPRVGIFAQRKKERPNRLGLCTVRLLGRSGRTLRVRGLDAIDGTPVVDIKPVFREFQPKGRIRQPAWVSSLMRNYW